MLISYEHQFLFIHIPKSAGMSVDAVLKPYAECPDDVPRNRLLMKLGIRGIYWGPYRQKRFRRHDTIRRVYDNIPRAEFDRLFKFAFVRNPWDRLVSLYHFRQQRSVQFGRGRRYKSFSFEQFLNYELRFKRSGTQAEFLCDRDGRLLTDYVGRFEQLNEDFGHVARLLGLDVALPHRNQSQHKDYRSYYTPATIDLVAHHCRRDLQLFGYTFEGTSQSVAAA